MKTNIILWGLLLLLSCGRQPDEANRPTLEMGPSVVLELDSALITNPWYMDYFEKGGDSYLGMVDKERGAWYVYNLATSKLAHHINIPKEGPEFLRDLAGFYFHNEDSILFMGQYGSGVQLRNWEGTLLKTYYFIGPGNEKFEAFARRTIHNTSKIFYHEGYYYVAGHKHYSMINRPEQYFDLGHEIKLDPRNETFEFLPVAYPDEYRLKAMNPGMSRTFRPSGQLIYNYAYLDDISTFDLSTSTFLPNRELLSSSQINVEYVPVYQVGDSNCDLVYPQYEQLIFDPFRRLYYRLLYEGVSLKDKETGAMNDFWNSPYRLLIANDKFEKIGEYRLAKNLYYSENWFVSPDGFHLSTVNPHNAKAKEERMVFQTFQLD